ncbi:MULTISPECIES: helicase HerA-like domain-containing protein [unclassified Phyllobacterium]|uniref:helicase HerA-like domain-containing protein n=1 Tax=unclassified Phyllobacterium TaxID=2638441 RepID=UPI003012D984
MELYFGTTATGIGVNLPLRFANRHGLVTGATGTGKTVTLQRLAEEFSRNGVPVFAADVKSDLSGIATSFPAEFWDIYGRKGLQIRTSVQEMGAQLISRMLGLNETQQGAVEIAFRIADKEQCLLLTLDDLRWALSDMLDNREDVCKEHGNITAASISAIQRNLLALEAQGGANLFGEPPFDIPDFIRTDDNGRGIINLLHADQLMEAPKLYATFLLWLLTELFRRLPEAGDLDKPKLVFFFDEAHLLFRDAPRPLVQSIERLVRLVRSKGVGVYFVTQSPADVPDTVLAQLGNRIQHALRAYTPSDQRNVKASANAFRPNPGVDVKAEITAMGVGEALVSMLQDNGVPQPVEKVRITKPSAQIGPVSDLERETTIAGSRMFEKYKAGMLPHEASHAFGNRMKAQRGIEFDAAAGAQAPEESIYLKHIPNLNVEEAADRPSIIRFLLRIAFWGSITFLGLKMAGLT